MVNILQNFDQEISDMYKAYRMSHFSMYLMKNNFYEFKDLNPQIDNFVLKDPITDEEVRFTENEVNKNSENGLYQSILAGNTIAVFYNLWEDKYRKLIASNLKLEKSDIQSDFFGELKLIRHSITHNNYNAISDLKKLKITSFIYETNSLQLTSLEVEKKYNGIKLQITEFKNLYCS